jgi:hypothetical protein
VQRTNEQLALVYLYSQRDEWVVGMIDVEGNGGTEGGTDGRTDRQRSKIKSKVSFMGLYWLPVCDTKYK